MEVIRKPPPAFDRWPCHRHYEPIPDRQQHEPMPRTDWARQEYPDGMTRCGERMYD